MSLLRLQVLSGYKSLHKVARVVFAGDEVALLAARVRINEEFKKNKHIADSGSISEMLKFAGEVENELKTAVVQAKEKQPGVFELSLNKNTNLLDNVEFQEDAVLPKQRPKRCK